MQVISQRWTVCFSSNVAGRVCCHFYAVDAACPSFSGNTVWAGWEVESCVFRDQAAQVALCLSVHLYVELRHPRKEIVSGFVVLVAINMLNGNFDRQVSFEGPDCSYHVNVALGVGNTSKFSVGEEDSRIIVTAEPYTPFSDCVKRADSLEREEQVKYPVQLRSVRIHIRYFPWRLADPRAWCVLSLWVLYDPCRCA